MCHLSRVPCLQHLVSSIFTFIQMSKASSELRDSIGCGAVRSKQSSDIEARLIGRD